MNRRQRREGMKWFWICCCLGEQPPLPELRPGACSSPVVFFFAEPGGRPGAPDDPGERAGRGGEHPPEDQQEPLRLLRSHHHQTGQMKRRPPALSPLCLSLGKNQPALGHADLQARVAPRLASVRARRNAPERLPAPSGLPLTTRLRWARGCCLCSPAGCVQDTTGTVCTPRRRSVLDGGTPRSGRLPAERPGGGAAFGEQLLPFSRLFPRPLCFFSLLDPAVQTETCFLSVGTTLRPLPPSLPWEMLLGTAGPTAARPCWGLGAWFCSHRAGAAQLLHPHAPGQAHGQGSGVVCGLGCSLRGTGLPPGRGGVSTVLFPIWVR